MGRAPDFKRIAKEDFPKDDQRLVEKLAYPINSFIEQTRNLFTKNIDFENLNQEVIEITLTVNAAGAPLVPAQYKSNLRTRVQGMICISADNLTTPGTPPLNTPFATFIQSTTIVTISNIKGLDANQLYRLRFLTIG